MDNAIGAGSLSLTVVIVSYNTRELTLACLASLGEAGEIIVVDNASTDGTAEAIVQQYPNVKVIQNSSNRGFGAANNQGIDAANHEVVLLLNSDAVAHASALSTLLKQFEDSSVVAAGGKLLFPNGTVQQSCCNELTLWAVICEQTLLEKLFPSSKLFSPYWMSHRLLALGKGPFEVEQVMGACLAMRKLEKFNEDFFLYCEDTELCMRLRKHGKILYVPEAEFGHALGASSKADPWLAIARYNRGKELYFRIHHGKFHEGFCWYMNRKGATFRLLIWGIPCLLTLGLVGRFRKQAFLWSKVLFAPVYGPPRPSDS